MIVTMPATLYRFSSMRFNVQTQNTFAESGVFNPTPGVDGPSFARWRARLTYSPRFDEDIDDLDQFISLLKGGLNLCRIYDLRKGGGPSGAGGAGPVVNVSGSVEAGATSVTFKNLLPSEAEALRMMDHFAVGENLHRIQYSGPSNADGEGTFEFWPPARHGWAEDDPVNLLNPTGLFRVEDGQDDLTISPPVISDSLTLSFIEVPNFDA